MARRRHRAASSVFTAPNISISARVTANSLPDRRTMPESLMGQVDSWSEEGAPVFTSKASARRFAEESRRQHAAGKIDREWHYDDVPTAAEARQEREAKVRQYREDMLKRPRPKDF